MADVEEASFLRAHRGGHWQKASYFTLRTLGELRPWGESGQVQSGWGKEPQQLFGILPGPTLHCVPYSRRLKTLNRRNPGRREADEPFQRWKESDERKVWRMNSGTQCTPLHCCTPKPAPGTYHPIPECSKQTWLQIFFDTSPLRYVFVSFGEYRWACDYSRSDALWFPKPGHKRCCSFHIAGWNIHTEPRGTTQEVQVPGCCTREAICSLSVSRPSCAQSSSYPCQVEKIRMGSFSPNWFQLPGTSA